MRQFDDKTLLTAAACVTFAVYGAMMTAVGPALPSIARSFSLSLGQVGAIFAAGGVGFVLVVFLAGYAADILGKRGVLLAGIAFIAVGLSGMAFAPTFEIIAIGSLIQNVGSGLLESSIGSLVIDLHPNRRTTALNLLHSCFGFGALVGPLYAGALVAIGDWREMLLGGAGAFVVLAVVIVRQRFPRSETIERVEWSQVGGLARSRLIQFAGLAIMLYVAGELSLSAWAFPYLDTIRGYSTLIASLGVSLFWAGIAIGRAASAWLARFLSPARIVQGSAGLCGIGAIGLLVSPDPTTALVALTVSGLGAAAVYPTIMAIACARYAHMSGSVTGLITTATGVGILFGPWVVGRLGDTLGLQLALASVAAMMALVVIIYQLRTASEAPATATQSLSESLSEGQA